MLIEEYQPVTCGQCERYHEGHCIPVKDKYGSESVDFDQKPSINCPYKEGRCTLCLSPVIAGCCTGECRNNPSMKEVL